VQPHDTFITFVKYEPYGSSGSGFLEKTRTLSSIPLQPADVMKITTGKLWISNLSLIIRLNVMKKIST